MISLTNNDSAYCLISISTISQSNAQVSIPLHCKISFGHFLRLQLIFWHALKPDLVHCLIFVNEACNVYKLCFLITEHYMNYMCLPSSSSSNRAWFVSESSRVHWCSYLLTARFYRMAEMLNVSVENERYLFLFSVLDLPLVEFSKKIYK